MAWKGDCVYRYSKRGGKNKIGTVDVINFNTLEKVTMKENCLYSVWSMDDEASCSGGLPFWNAREGFLDYPLFKLSAISNGFSLVLKEFNCGLVLEVVGNYLALNKVNIGLIQSRPQAIAPFFKVDYLYKAKNIYYMQASVSIFAGGIWCVQFRMGKTGQISVRLKGNGSSWFDWCSVPMLMAKQFLMYNIK